LDDYLRLICFLSTSVYSALGVSAIMRYINRRFTYLLTYLCRLDYCNSLLHAITDSLFQPLQSIQNTAAHLIKGCTATGSHHSGSDLHWLPVRRHVDYKLALLVYKSLHSLVPPYLADDCILASSDKFRSHLHSADMDICIVPRTRTRFGDRSFSTASLPAPRSGTAYRRICDSQTLSLANSVNYWRHFCLFRDSRDGSALVTL